MLGTPLQHPANVWKDARRADEIAEMRSNLAGFDEETTYACVNSVLAQASNMKADIGSRSLCLRLICKYMLILDRILIEARYRFED